MGQLVYGSVVYFHTSKIRHRVQGTRNKVFKRKLYFLYPVPWGAFKLLQLIIRVFANAHLC